MYDFTRRKGLKSFGPVDNILCNSPTGLYLGRILSAFEENIAEVISKHVDAECFSKVDMHNGTLNGDRGCEFDGSNINCHCFNTTKRSSTLTFSFGTCKS